MLPLIASAVKQYEVSRLIKTSVAQAECELRLSARRATPPRWDKEQCIAQMEQEQKDIAEFEEAEKRSREAVAHLKLA